MIRPTKRYTIVIVFFTIFTNYQAGATIQEDLAEADVIMSVKEVPIPLLMQDKTYMFFSHTIKAQPNNMPMLDEILKRVCKCRFGALPLTF